MMSSLKRRARQVVRVCLTPLSFVLSLLLRRELSLLRHELAVLRDDMTILRGSALELHTRLGQQLADEFVWLQTRLAVRQDHHRAA
jgi:hypothetical protein